MTQISESSGSNQTLKPGSNEKEHFGFRKGVFLVWGLGFFGGGGGGINDNLYLQLTSYKGDQKQLWTDVHPQKAGTGNTFYTTVPRTKHFKNSFSKKTGHINKSIYIIL